MKEIDKRDLRSDMVNVMKGLHLRFSFSNLGYLPRWVVLLLDIGVIIFTSIFTYLLFKGVKLTYVSTAHFLVASFLYLFVNIFFFWVFKIYSGIIRHSSYIDAIKIFFAQITSLTVLVVINLLFRDAYEGTLFLNTGLFINTTLSFTFLFFYRVVVKHTFDKYISIFPENEMVNALIYGTSNEAIAVANALKVESPSRFRLLGFIDKENQNTSKRILDLPILKLTKRIAVMMRSVNVEALIIADKNLSKEERSTLVEDCLEFNYKVYTVPLLKDLENQEEISKSIKSFDIHDLLERKPIVLDMNSIASQLNGKVILVTGAAGSIGSEIVRQVLEFNPKTLIILDQAETPLHSLSLEIANCNPTIEIKNILADVRNKKALKQIFELYKPQVIYHAAAYKHVPLMEENPLQAVYTNVLGTKNLADLAQKHNAERFVMVSTDKAVNPSNVMGASKRIAEKYVQSLHFKLKDTLDGSATKFITTRFGNVLGSNGSVVPLFKKQIEEGGPITITHPDIIRYFMTIPEACQLVLEAGAMGNGGEIYIFDMGKPVKIIDLARKMIKLAGFKPDVEIKIKIVGLRPGEKLYEELLNDTSKTLPTHHKKIMIAEDVFEDYEGVKVGIHDLVEISELNSNNEIVSKMKVLVPEFKSLNSEFECLDN